jgi:tRNA nucleotidyltransferase (CCA-adding enzyme)
MNISRKILSDPVNRWLFSKYGQEIYLVGGYIRDILLGEAATDRDYVIKGDPEKIARSTANKFVGTFIDFKGKGTLRIALKEGKYIDFTELHGSITEDLSRRDFTVNAIAWSPSQGIIAPPSHIVDLKNREIKVVRPENLKDDPLRILRAYRIGSQLAFTIELHTRKYLRKYASDLGKIASERITDEIIKMINQDNSLNYIRLCMIDKVISQVVPLSPSNIDITLHQLTNFNTLLQQIEGIQNGTYIKKHLDSELRQGLKRAGLVRLYLLIRNARTTPGMNVKTSHKWYGRLDLSTALKKGITGITKAEAFCHNRLSDSRLYDILNTAYPYTYEMACVISLIKVHFKKYFLKAGEFSRYRNNPLITGNDAMKLMKISEGAFVGSVIDTIQRLRFTGQIKDRRSALSWITSNLT